MQPLRVVLPLLLLAGCATPPAEPPHQTIDVHVESPTPLPLLDCTAHNDLGRWSFAAPGPVVVQVSHRPLALQCELPGAGVARASAAAHDPVRAGGRTGATVGSGLGVAAGAAAVPFLGPAAVVLFAFGGAMRGAEIGSIVGAVGGTLAYPAVIVVKVVPAP